MFDPLSVAHEIRLPWRKYKPWPKGVENWDTLTEQQKRGRSPYWREGFRNSLLTIWHKDPCTDGTDNSCGMCWAKLTKDQYKCLQAMAWDEGRAPWYLKHDGKSLDYPVAAECLIRAAILQVAGRLDIPLTVEEATRLAIENTHFGEFTWRRSLCFIPGYHSNFSEDRSADREYSAMQFFSCIARVLLTRRRKWYQHARWHVWHWRFQFHPWQDFKHWMWPEPNQNQACETASN